jgi:DNA modification methylase
LGIPDLLKRALMEEGWICRSTIIWSKPNPMPESVTDRPTKAHEQVFLLAKSERYFFDAEAVREKITDRHNSIGTNNVIRSGLMDGKVLGRESNVHGGLGDWEQNPAGRNVRSVWSISSEAFPGSHFAVMPRKLVEPCVKAGTSQAGCCPACGRAWERVTERESQVEAGHARGHNAAYCEGRAVNGASIKKWLSRDLGFRQSCQCEPAPPVPCLVLDCFGGAQTVGVVATGLGRRYVGFDLNPEYLAMGRRRIERPHSQVRKVEKKHPLFASLEDAS